MSIQSGTSPGAIISAGETPAGAPVTSVFGRVGVVVAVPGDYGSDDITNESGVAGATVSDALDQLDADITGLTSDDIANASTVVGATVSNALDQLDSDITNLDSSDIANVSTVVGVTVTDALDTLNTDITNLDSSDIANASGVVGVTISDALNTLNTGGSSPYTWTWADATTRLAQSVIAAEVGFKGFQTDIALEYQLFSVSPSRWVPLTDPSMGFPRIASGNPGIGAIVNNFGTNVTGVSGTLAARTPTATNIATQMSRVGLVSAAGAGSIILERSVTGQSAISAGGWRVRFHFTLSQVTAAMRWFVGFAATPATANVNPNTFLSSIGVGRNAQANTQFYNNDAAGVATETDLGASFPPVTADTAYDLMMYSLTGAAISYNLRNMGTGAEISGEVVSNIPPTSALLTFLWYGCNNTDAVVVEIGIGDVTLQQRVV